MQDLTLNPQSQQMNIPRIYSIIFIMSRRFFAILNLAGFVATVVVNTMANALPLNKKTTGQLSDQYPNLFVPAGMTFSIWGLIYLLLGAFVAYHLIRAFGKDRPGTSLLDGIGFFFFISSITNVAWIFAWHYEFIPLSVSLMLFLLWSLKTIYSRLNIGRAEATKEEKYFVMLPFSVYLGWISGATVANITVLLVALQWNRFGLGEPFWAVVAIALVTALALLMLFLRRDVVYALVIGWTLLGILIKRLTAGGRPVVIVIAAALAGMILLTAGVILQFTRKRSYYFK